MGGGYPSACDDSGKVNDKIGDWIIQTLVKEF